jgi:hypothetical protein
LRPTGSGGGGFWSSIVPGLQGLISTLELIKNKEWAALWSQFKVLVNEQLNGTILSGDPTGIPLYSWLANNFIPAIEALADGEWATAWEKLGGAAAEGLVSGFTENEAFIRLGAFFAALKAGDVMGAWDILGEMSPGGAAARTPAPGTPPPSGTPNGIPDWVPGWIEKFWEGLADQLQDLNPGGAGARTQLQGFGGFDGFPGIAPLTPALAGATSTVSGDTVVNNVQINQQIATNGDFGGARQGAAEGIREALIKGRLT